LLRAAGKTDVMPAQACPELAEGRASNLIFQAPKRAKWIPAFAAMTAL
jgi:hypothetical protein